MERVMKEMKENGETDTKQKNKLHICKILVEEFICTFVKSHHLGV